jgi:HEAT repeat protein
MNETDPHMRAVARFFWVVVVAAVSCCSAQSQAPTPTPNSEAKNEAASSPAANAWLILHAGLKNNSKDVRSTAARVLGLISRDLQSRKLAERALEDKEPEVRVAAASALGRMGAKQSVPRLRRALKDEHPSVVLSAANSLRMLRDPEAYRVYYAILTGESKTGEGLLKEQEKMLKDPKKMAVIGFEEGIGFIPFAGMGFQVFKALKKDDSSPVRAAAAKALAKDPKSESAEALVEAAAEGSWIVRTAALEAIADRGDPTLLPRIVKAMDDGKDAVRYTAAAAVVHLSSIKPKTEAPKTTAKK